MGFEAFAIVMAAALMHAAWNAMVKGATDRTAVLGLIALGHVGLGIILAMSSELPAVESWPFLIGSTVAHWLYYYLLNTSYRLGDLSQMYPIARGIAPVLVALGAQIWADEALPLPAWGGIFLVSLGIFFLTLGKKKNPMQPGALFAALSTGVVISSYSVIDGMGVRVSGSPMGYIAWLFILEAFVTFYIFFYRGRVMLQLSRNVLLLGLIGGLVSAGAYGLVIYAKSIAPLGIVSALRETSVLFAALIGILWFGERPWKSRVISAAIVVIGVTVIAFTAV